MSRRTRRAGAAFALTSAAVGLATLGTGLPDEPETGAPLAAPEAVPAISVPTAAPAPVRTPVPTPGPAEGATGEPPLEVVPTPQAAGVGHLPPPPDPAVDPADANSTAPDAAVAAGSRVSRGRVIQIREHDIRLLSNGRLLHEGARPRGPLTLSQLHDYLRSPRWMELADGQARIKAALYLSPGTHLIITADDARTVRLMQTRNGHGGNILGSGATLTVRGAELTGWDPATDAPAPLGPTRPYISLNRGSSLRLTDASFASLGRTGSGRTGVSLHDGREFTALRTTFTDSVIGMTSVRTGQTRLDRVTARSNAGPGVVVRGGELAARSITTSSNAGPGLHVEDVTDSEISSVTTERNSGAGLLVRGTRLVRIDSVRANGNTTGLQLSRSERATITHTTTSGNTGAGLDVLASTNTTVDDTLSVHDRSGLAVRGGEVAGSEVALHRARVYSAADIGVRIGSTATRAAHLLVTGSPAGIVIGNDAVGATLTDSRVEGAATGLRVMTGSRNTEVSTLAITPPARGDLGDTLADPLADPLAGDPPRADVGADLNGRHTALADVRVSHAETGFVVRAGSDDITLTRAIATETDTGIRVQQGVQGVALRDVTVTDATHGLDAASPGLVVDGGRFTSLHTGMKLAGAATLTDVHVEASDCGIRSVTGGQHITAGSVRARKPSCGDADLGTAQILPPTAPRGLGVFAGAMVTLAIAYESVRALRERRPAAPIASAASASAPAGAEGQAPQKHQVNA